MHPGAHWTSNTFGEISRPSRMEQIPLSANAVSSDRQRHSTLLGNRSTAIPALPYPVLVTCVPHITIHSTISMPNRVTIDDIPEDEEPSWASCSLRSSAEHSGDAIGMDGILGLLIEKAPLCLSLAISAISCDPLLVLVNALHGISFPALRAAVLVAGPQQLSVDSVEVSCMGLNMGLFKAASLYELHITFLPFGWRRPNFYADLSTLVLNLFEHTVPLIMK
ncbi:hypothetical protein K438DRAFT_1753910 [Mycena galopus ATCC 62051]|nr:hypothetical protein K438DRAFT_1753910 [Mycena galopus ATCC 62051]